MKRYGQVSGESLMYVYIYGIVLVLMKFLNFFCFYFFVIVDINECSALGPVCDANAKCENIIGSYLCSCKSGFFGNGKTCTGEKEESIRKLALFNLMD